MRAGNWGKSSSSGRRRAKAPWYLTTLYWCLYGALGWAAYLNISPYEKMVRYLTGQVQYFDLWEFLSNIWVIGPIFAAISQVFTFGVGAVLWACFQIPEVLPLILLGHGLFLKAFIQQADSAQKYQVKDGDDFALKIAKRAANRLPTEVLSNLLLIMAFAYLLDLFLCCIINPPVLNGTIFDLVTVIATGQYSRLDWDAIGLNLIILFAVETIILGIIFVGKLMYFMRQSSN
ncbi:hypothetical protein [Mastigocoleus testarum]|uniref:Uncharacterized protein n=1 Tax=Mastigocoleus testarum BC008 TaxID=371196 RepID=A0A0V7ZG09_9CYAN|nr:hypothetical protein [Mastigocoleus testarum]KST63509.1 hypothetical protein BC008_13680 [Mastigocoleus testarum BC008]